MKKVLIGILDGVKNTSEFIINWLEERPTPPAPVYRESVEDGYVSQRREMVEERWARQRQLSESVTSSPKPDPEEKKRAAP